MTKDARSSPYHDLPSAHALDGTEYVAIEQLIDAALPDLGTHDVKLPLSALAGVQPPPIVDTSDPLLWQSSEPIAWLSGEQIDWVS
jgi:hypothetical protein